MAEKDRLYRAGIAVLCELSVLNPNVFAACNGVTALTRALLDSSVPRVAEAIIGCLLALHNNPSTRSLCNFRLGVVVAPFTEFRYVHSSHTLSGGGGGNTATATADQEEREFRFQSSETAILCLVRSWTGLMLLIEPDKNGVSHLQALTDILYLDNFKVRKR